MPEDPNDSRITADGAGPGDGTPSDGGGQAAGGVGGGGQAGPDGGTPGEPVSSTLDPEEATYRQRFAATKTAYDAGQTKLKAVEQALAAFEERHGISVADWNAQQEEAAEAVVTPAAPDPWGVQYGAFGGPAQQVAQQAPAMQPVVEDAVNRCTAALQAGDFAELERLKAYYYGLGIPLPGQQVRQAPQAQIQPGMTQAQVQQILDQRLADEHLAGVQFHRGIKKLERDFSPEFLTATVNVDGIEMTREEALEEYCRKTRQSDPEAALLTFDRQGYIGALVAQGVNAKLKELTTQGQGEQVPGTGIFAPPEPPPPSAEMTAVLPGLGLAAGPPTE